VQIGKIKRKERYTFSRRDIDFLSFIRNLKNADLSFSEIKKIEGVHTIPNTNSRRKLLRLYESLEKLSEKVEIKRNELEQLRKDILGFKKNLRNFDESSSWPSET
jgi:DNA-binding transcriptional MerR regulator